MSNYQPGIGSEAAGRWPEPAGEALATSKDSLGQLPLVLRNPTTKAGLYDAGRALRYGPGHSEDHYGGLGQASLYDSDEDWNTFEIPEAEFKQVWRTYEE